MVEPQFQLQDIRGRLHGVTAPEQGRPMWTIEVDTGDLKPMRMKAYEEKKKNLIIGEYYKFSYEPMPEKGEFKAWKKLWEATKEDPPQTLNKPAPEQQGNVPIPAEYQNAARTQDNAEWRNLMPSLVHILGKALERGTITRSDELMSWAVSGYQALLATKDIKSALQAFAQSQNLGNTLDNIAQEAARPLSANPNRLEEPPPANQQEYGGGASDPRDEPPF